MRQTAVKKLSFIVLAVCFAVFGTLWCVRELVLRDWLLSNFGETGQELIGETLKVIIWTCPAIYLIARYKDAMLIGLREMFLTRVKWLRFLPVFAVFALYIIVGAYLHNGEIKIHPNFKPLSLVGAVLFVGITEEVVFRGFLLNALLKKTNQWAAISVTALLFLVIHFPIWISTGVFAETILSGGFVSIIALSVVFSWAFIKSKSLAVPILLHMFWNLNVCLFFG